MGNSYMFQLDRYFLIEHALIMNVATFSMKFETKRRWNVEKPEQYFNGS